MTLWALGSDDERNGGLIANIMWKLNIVLVGVLLFCTLILNISLQSI